MGNIGLWSDNSFPPNYSPNYKQATGTQSPICHNVRRWPGTVYTYVWPEYPTTPNRYAQWTYCTWASGTLPTINRETVQCGMWCDTHQDQLWCQVQKKISYERKQVYQDRHIVCQHKPKSPTCQRGAKTKLHGQPSNKSHSHLIHQSPCIWCGSEHPHQFKGGIYHVFPSDAGIPPLSTVAKATKNK